GAARIVSYTLSYTTLFRSLERALVPGCVRLRPRGHRGRIRRRPAARAEPRPDDALLRGRLLVADPVHDADGAHRHLRLRSILTTDRKSTRLNSSHVSILYA